MSIKGETISGVKWTSIEQFAVRGVNFLVGLVLARLLSPEDFGTIAMMGIFMAISSTFIDSGFGKALVQKQNRTDIDCSTVFYFNIVTAIVFYLLLFILSPWVANYFHTPILKTVLRVQAINLIVNALCAIHLAKLTIALDFAGIAKRSLLSSIVSGVFGIILAYLGFGIWALIGQGLACSITNVAFIWAYCKWRPSWTFSWDSFRSLFSYGGFLLLSGLLNTIVSELTSLIIGRHYSSKDLGYYNRGTSIARYPNTSINGVLNKVMFPVLTKIQDDDEHLVHVYRKYICITSMCIFFACCLLAALAKPVILLLLTEKWKDSIIFLQIFSFAIMFDHINSINLSLLQVKGRTKYFFRLEVIKKAISVAILFASIPFGVIAICASKIVYSQIAIIINCYYTGKYFGLGYFQQYKDFGVFFLLSVFSCLPAYLLTLQNYGNLITIIAGVIISSCIFLLLIHKSPYFIELYETIKNSLHKG